MSDTYDYEEYVRHIVSNTCEVKVTQSCSTLYYPMDCTSPGFSVPGILQARILEWIIILFSRESSRPTDQTQVSCNVGRFFTI